MSTVSTFWWIAGSTEFTNDRFGVLFVLFLFFNILGLGVFSLLYPFHLLNTDYKNKVMSLVFASGVSRAKYYFVKVGATILSGFIAIFAILLIPMLTFLVIYPEIFTELVQKLVKGFSVSDVTPFVLCSFFGLLSNMVVLTTAVIVTRGKTSGIFLFFLFLFLNSSAFSLFENPLNTGDSISEIFYTGSLHSIISICVYVAIGLAVLKRQDL
ncbi:MAG: hypothetical protein LBR60_09675 [Fibrobacter sp.]|nr:hypothetical protein [Fibrobacter sp.]